MRERVLPVLQVPAGKFPVEPIYNKLGGLGQEVRG